MSSTRPDPGSNPEAVVIGAAVRQLRDTHGYSQDDLIRMSGVGRGPLQDLETGRRLTRAGSLRKIAAAFDMDLPALRVYARRLAAKRSNAAG